MLRLLQLSGQRGRCAALEVVQACRSLVREYAYLVQPFGAMPGLNRALSNGLCLQESQ